MISLPALEGKGVYVRVGANLLRRGLKGQLFCEHGTAYTFLQCCGSGFALIWLSRIRIWIHLGKADSDPDPVERKLTKINKNPDFQAFQKGFCTLLRHIL